jgi:hypothetical protein
MLISRTRWLATVLIATGFLIEGCHRTADVDHVTLGSKVEVTTADGSTVDGTLVKRTGDAIVIERAKSGERDTIRRAAIARVEAPAPSPLSRLSGEPTTHEVTVPAGTAVPLTLDVALGSDSSDAEDPVTATVRTPVMIDGSAVIPDGSTLRGHVTTAARAGKAKRRGALAFRFEQLTIDHRDYDVSTRSISYEANGSDKKAAAAMNHAAGAVVVLTTPGHDVHLDPGAELTAHLTAPVAVAVPDE